MSNATLTPKQATQAVRTGARGGKYLWGSDNPFMSWCDDSIKLMTSYTEEVEALKALPAAVREDGAEAAPGG